MSRNVWLGRMNLCLTILSSTACCFYKQSTFQSSPPSFHFPEETFHFLVFQSQCKLLCSFFFFLSFVLAIGLWKFKKFERFLWADKRNITYYFLLLIGTETTSFQLNDTLKIFHLKINCDMYIIIIYIYVYVICIFPNFLNFQRLYIYHSIYIYMYIYHNLSLSERF